MGVFNHTTLGLVAFAGAGKTSKGPTNLLVNFRAVIFKFRFLVDNKTWSPAWKVSTLRRVPAIFLSYFRLALSNASRVWVTVANMALANSSALGTSSVGRPRLAGVRISRA